MINEIEVAKMVVDIRFHINYNYGQGLNESVYEEIFCYECMKTGILFKRYDGIHRVVNKL
jgi:hypothetical protein